MKKGVVSVLSALIGAVVGAGTVGKRFNDKVQKINSMSNKHLALFLMMNQWVKIKQEGKSLAGYLDEKGYKKIAIYGMSYAGETLSEELRNTGIEVVYGIDKNVDSIYSEIEIVSPEHDLRPVDAVIVTAITFFNEVEEELSEKVTCPIISLEDILYEV